jgi:hypothetical protein
MLKHKLVDFIIQFMEEVDKEISEMKLLYVLVLAAPTQCANMMGSFETDIQTAKRKSTVCSGIFSDTSKPSAYHL